ETHRSIVFVNTKMAAEKVTRALEKQGFAVATLSGDVPQAKRERLLGKFQKGEIELLVATDVAARGLHIPDVSHVFNYDLPHDPEDYVHRIGRTARLGAEGDAISFACDLYAMGLPDIESYIEQKIPTAPITPDLLVVPPPRPPAAPVATLSAEDEAAGDAQHRRRAAEGRRARAAQAPPAQRRDGAPRGVRARRQARRRTRARRACVLCASGRAGAGRAAQRRRRRGAAIRRSGRAAQAPPP